MHDKQKRVLLFLIDMSAGCGGGNGVYDKQKRGLLFLIDVSAGCGCVVCMSSRLGYREVMLAKAWHLQRHILFNDKLY